ncbi:unnamed protein product [Eruca vesicaria subsp. sativa]|uniref:Uncharacterized protein n=1 Tax=Eruca vesicaria subsp. sativa TaxID=29727 RepID=A0ABC8IWD3_ERUVS|nr:unnamed protein product [Eruca vesicaria subsp. sativa]
MLGVLLGWVFFVLSQRTIATGGGGGDIGKIVNFGGGDGGDEDGDDDDYFDEFDDDDDGDEGGLFRRRMFLAEVKKNNYRGADVFIPAFSLIGKASYENIAKKAIERERRRRAGMGVDDGLQTDTPTQRQVLEDRSQELEYERNIMYSSINLFALCSCSQAFTNLFLQIMDSMCSFDTNFTRIKKIMKLLLFFS